MLAKIEDLLADRVALRAEVAGLRERLADDRVTCGACLDPGNPSAPHDVTDCGCIYAPRGHVLADRLRARLAEVLEAGERFLAVADDVAKTAEVMWHRTQKALGAAALSRAGKIEEGRAIVAELDRSPTVWNFGRTVDDLAEAAAAWRRAARRGT